MNNKVLIDNRRQILVVEPQGLDKMWGFVRRIEVPIDQIRGATHDPGVTEDYKGVRGPGLGIPGHKWVGTWRKDGQRHYWNVTGGKTTIVIQTTTPRFQRLYLSVEDPRAIVDLINATMTAHH
jgi:hypothetical protein